MKMEFSERLRKMRERRGITRKTLAECCGLSKNTIARYERGERVPTMDALIRIADFFEITVDELIRP